MSCDFWTDTRGTFAQSEDKKMEFDTWYIIIVFHTHKNIFKSKMRAKSSCF